MQDLTHRAALGAAARVAFSVTLLGCSGTSVSGAASPDPGAGAGDGDEDTETTAEAVRRVPTRKPCSKAPPQKTRATCEAVVGAALPDGGSFDRTQPVDPDVKACCKILADAHDQEIKDGKGGWEWTERGYCCGMLGWSGNVTCTPWGPPVPPAFARRRAPAGAA
jgi:hypothetical protein